MTDRDRFWIDRIKALFVFISPCLDIDRLLRYLGLEFDRQAMM